MKRNVHRKYRTNGRYEMVADDQTRAKMYRLLSLKSFVSERDDFVIETLVDLEPKERFENRRDMLSGAQTMVIAGKTGARNITTSECWALENSVVAS